MRPEFLVPVLIVFIVVGLPVLSATLIKLAKIIKGEPSNSGGNRQPNDPANDRQEAEIVQEINQLVTRLEKRIDALETIVLDQSRKR